MTLLPLHPRRQPHPGQRAAEKQAVKSTMVLAAPSLPGRPAAAAAPIQEIPLPVVSPGTKEHIWKAQHHLSVLEPRIRGEPSLAGCIL